MLQTIEGVEEKINACSATDTRTMVAYYQQYLETILSGINITWMAAYKGAFGRKLWHTNLMDDWKVVDAVFPVGSDKITNEEAKAYFKQAREMGDLDPQVILGVKTMGKTRVQLIGDAVSKEEWSTHWMKDFMLAQGAGERIVGAYTLSAEAESFFTVDRVPGAEPFNEEDRESFYNALVRFPRLHYWLFLERGLIAPATRPLSPRERDVLQLLLGRYSEQEIADSLGLKKGTTHNYIGDIFKNYNVQSRYELIQLWLKEIPLNDTNVSE